jgi:hypothetical protein
MTVIGLLDTLSSAKLISEIPYPPGFISSKRVTANYVTAHVISKVNKYTMKYFTAGLSM